MFDITRTIPYDQVIRVQKLLKDQFIWVETFVNNPKFINQIKDWIRQDQLKKTGQNADGDIIGYYSYFTSLISPEKRFNTPYTLEDTGEFYKSIFVEVLRDELLIDGDTDKMEDQEWWNERIVALNEENKQKLINAYKQKAIDYANKILVGRF